MGESGTAKCSIVLIMIFNTIFILHGAAFIAGAAYVMIALAGITSGVETQLVQSGVPISFSVASVLIGPIVYGSIIVIFGLVGCIGAIVRNKAALGTYIYCLAYFLLIYLAIGASVLFVLLAYRSTLNALFISGDPDQQIPYVDHITGWVQRGVHCCGAKGPSDYDMKMLPVTCCELKKEAFAKNITELEPSDAMNYDQCKTGVGRYNNGCLEIFFYYVTIAAGVFFGLAGLEILLIVFASCLCCTTRKGKGNPMLRHKY